MGCQKLEVKPNAARLTRRPAHLPSPDDVAMQVRHRFTGVRTIVEYQAVATALQPQLVGYFRCFEKQMPEDLLVFRLCLGDSRDGFSRNN